MVSNFKEKIVTSFMKVKEDIFYLKGEINKLKESIFLKNNEISTLKSEIRTLNILINEKIGQKQRISIGNDRAINNHQQSSTIINNDSSLETAPKKTQDRPIKMLLENKFRSLTDMEFSVFMGIYQLEEELNKVTYKDIATRFNLTEATVRNHVTNLINKGIPIDKERMFNKKAFLYIQKNFRDLNMASTLLELRHQIKTPMKK